MSFRITHITNALYGLAVVAVIGYGFATEYLGELAPKATAENAVPANAVEHRVTRIVDGDTVYTKDGTKIRLHGIDTPERDQPYGKQATRAYKPLKDVLFPPQSVGVSFLSLRQERYRRL